MRKRLALHEKTVYPQLAESVGADELALHFTPTEEEIEFATCGARLPASRLSLLVLLKLFRKLHRFPDPEEVAPSIIDHLRIQLRLGTAVLFEFDDPVQRARQRNAIRQYTGVMGWSLQARQIATEAGYEAALVMARPQDITNAVISALTHA